MQLFSTLQILSCLQTTENHMTKKMINGFQIVGTWLPVEKDRITVSHDRN